MLKGIADKKGDKKMDYGLRTTDTDSDLSCGPRPSMIRMLLHPLCCKNEGRDSPSYELRTWWSAIRFREKHDEIPDPQNA